MQQHGIQPTPVAFGILQQACWRHFDAAVEIRQLLRLMELMQIRPEIVNYNALIRAHGDAGELTMALQVANRMREAGIPWDQFTYQYLLNAVVSAEQIQVGVRLLTGMRQDGVRPRAKHYIAVFVGLAQAGFYEDAVRVFERLAAMGAHQAGLFAYNVMMGIHCRRGDMESALQTFKRISEAGMQPNTMSFRILLEGYVVSGDWLSALDMQAPLMEHKDRLRRMSTDVSVTQPAREAAARELQNKRNWTKAYYLLIDAALWNDEWVRAVDLVRDLVEQGLPAHPKRHARLVSDLQFYSSGSEPLAGVKADVLYLQLQETEAEDPLQRRQTDWLARVPNMPAVPSEMTEVADPTMLATSTQKVPLHVLAASFAPQWIDANSSITLDAVPELCKMMLGKDEVGVQLDLAGAFGLIHAYYHTTLHRRPVVSREITAREQILGRAGPETVESLQELFASEGWPGKAPHGYLFMRPSTLLVFKVLEVASCIIHSAKAGRVPCLSRPASANLDALLVLLGLAASYPGSVLLLKSEDLENREALSSECKVRKYQTLAATLFSILSAMPAAALVNARCWCCTSVRFVRLLVELLRNGSL